MEQAKRFKVDPRYWAHYIVSGKPRFALKSLRTGKEILLRAYTPRRDPNICHVYYFGTNNRIGSIQIDIGMFTYNQKNMDDLTSMSFSWFWRHLQLKDEQKLKEVEIWGLYGSCGRCKRPLKDEISMAVGIGPDCRKLLGIVIPKDFKPQV